MMETMLKKTLKYDVVFRSILPNCLTLIIMEHNDNNDKDDVGDNDEENDNRKDGGK